MVESEVVVRTAELGDLESIVELHTRARTVYYRAGGLSDAELDEPDGPARRLDGWSRSIQDDAKTVLCAVRAGTVVGAIAMGPPLNPDNDADRVGELYQIFVHPDSWSHGVGSRLHAAFVRFLVDASLPLGRLETWERNARARAFYARHGWRPDGQTVPGPANSYYLRLTLDVAGTGPVTVGR